MNYRTLGRTGIRVSEIGLGCWQFGGDFGAIDEARSLEILDEAARQGIDFWDTADVYGAGESERRIGAWLRDRSASSQKLPAIATKVGRSSELYPDGYTKEKVRSCLTGSLERLGVEALDLVQLHCVPFEVLKAGDLLGWMEDFRREGLCRHFGASVETIEEALFCLKHPGVASLQIIFNLFRQDAADKLFDAVERADVGVIVRLPLASGLLSGRWTADQQFAEQDHRNFNRDGDAFNVGETLSGLRLEKGVELVESLRPYVPEDTSVSQFAIRWILDHPAVSTVIAGTSRPEQVAENASVSALPPLDEEVHNKLRRFYEQKVRSHVRGSI